MQQITQSLSHYLEDELLMMLGGRSTFDLLEDTVLDGLWYWDIENPDHEYMSPRFWKTLGFDPAEKQHLASEWMGLIFPEDGELAKACAEQHFQNPVYPYDQVVRYYTKSGEPVTIRCRGKAILKDGKPVRLFGAHIIVSDQKRTAIEQRVDKMMHLSNDAIISWTEEAGVETWNKGAEACYGVRAADAFGKQPFDMSGAILPEPWEDMKRHMATGEDWLGEIVHKFADKPDVITATRISSEKLDDGRYLYLKICRDETKRIRAEQENELLLRELKHRVRNLFAVVQSITRLSSRSVSSISKFVDTLQGRISALAAAHTVGLGDDKLSSAFLQDILTQVLQAYEGEALRLDPPDAAITLSESSLTPLSLLINELATNAAKHGAWSQEGGQVHLSWRQIETADAPQVEMCWTEHLPLGAPTLSELTTDTTGQGFGTVLIDSSAAQLSGTLTRVAEGNRLCITLTFPA